MTSAQGRSSSLLSFSRRSDSSADHFMPFLELPWTSIPPRRPCSTTSETVERLAPGASPCLDAVGGYSDMQRCRAPSNSQERNCRRSSIDRNRKLSTKCWKRRIFLWAGHGTSNSLRWLSVQFLQLSLARFRLLTAGGGTQRDITRRVVGFGVVIGGGILRMVLAVWTNRLRTALLPLRLCVGVWVINRCVTQNGGGIRIRTTCLRSNETIVWVHLQFFNHPRSVVGEDHRINWNVIVYIRQPRALLRTGCAGG